MLIRPNYMRDLDLINNVFNSTSIKADLYKINTDIVISEKRLIHNFTNDLSPTYVRILYLIESSSSNDKINPQDELTLKYIAISTYDDNTYSLFGNVLYELSDYYYYIYDIHNLDYVMLDPKFTYHNMQSVYQILKEYETMDQIVMNKNNSKYVMFDNDTLNLHNLDDLRLTVYNPDINSKYHYNASYNDNPLYITKFTYVDLFHRYGKAIDIIQSVETNNMISTTSITDRQKNQYECEYIESVAMEFVLDMIDPDIIIGVDELSFVNDGTNTTIVNIKYPFNKIDQLFIEKAVLVYKYYIEKSINKFSDVFKTMRLMCYIHQSYIKLKLKVKLDNGNKYITNIVMSKKQIFDMLHSKESNF